MSLVLSLLILSKAAKRFMLDFESFLGFLMITSLTISVVLLRKGFMFQERRLLALLILTHADLENLDGSSRLLLIPGLEC